MTVKEMISSEYQLNGQTDPISNNSGVLTGDRPYFKGDALPKFHVPKFQAKVLSRVPNIERQKLLYPINISDFVFKNGV